MSRSDKQIYRLADVEVDSSLGLVRRDDGHEHRLRQQTLKVLLYLIENRERGVSKEELMRAIWNGTAVTDDALVQCIGDIRRALGDDSRRPRFIKTIPKVGYSLIAPVEVAGNGASAPLTVQTEEITSIKLEYEEEIIPPAVIEAVPKALPPVPHRRFNPKLVALYALAFLLIAAVASAVYWNRRKQAASDQQQAAAGMPRVAGKKALAVMYFENLSQSPELDWLREGLADMLITGLSRSKKLTALSRQQLHLLLERAGLRPNDKIAFDVALEIARKSQAEALVLGSYSRLGEKVRIDVQLYNVADGRLIAAENLTTDNLDQILTQIDTLSLKLATHLGAGATVRDEAELDRVMTSNLDAYRYYSLALEHIQMFQFIEAITLLEKAIALDPQFAMAYARIGYIYAVRMGPKEKARPYLVKAFQFSDRLSEKDRLHLIAWDAYARSDTARIVQTYRDIIEQYPLELEAYQRLAWILNKLDRNDEALAVANQALVIDGEAQDLYNLLGSIYDCTGRYSEGQLAYERYIQLAPNDPNAYDSLANHYQWLGEYDKAEATYERALQINPESLIAISHLGNLYFQQGRYEKAVRQYERYMQVTPSDEGRVRGYARIAWVQWKKGDLKGARAALQQLIKLTQDLPYGCLPIAYAVGDPAVVRKMKSILSRKEVYAAEEAHGWLRIHFYSLGQIALNEGRSEEAVTNFQEALKYRPIIWDLDSLEDCLAEAYLQLGRLDEAINEYERILRLNPNYPLAHYHLAQAYERKGDSNQARAQYEQFLQVWKDADPDLPEIIAARRQLAKPS